MPCSWILTAVGEILAECPSEDPRFLGTTTVTLRFLFCFSISRCDINRITLRNKHRKIETWWQGHKWLVPRWLAPCNRCLPSLNHWQALRMVEYNPYEFWKNKNLVQYTVTYFRGRCQWSWLHSKYRSPGTDSHDRGHCIYKVRRHNLIGEVTRTCARLALRVILFQRSRR